jgi:hypothetical protein
LRRKQPFPTAPRLLETAHDWLLRGSNRLEEHDEEARRRPMPHDC